VLHYYYTNPDNAGNGSSSSDGNSDDTSSDDITSTRTSMRTGNFCLGIFLFCVLAFTTLLF
jgi:hypothetical protein